MKSGAFLCTTLLCIGMAGPVMAANRTTQLGAIDSIADATFLRMLESGQADGPASPLPLLDVQFDMPGASLAAVSSGAARSQESHTSEVGLMALLGAALIAFHLRRRQKSLPYRPLGDVLYR